MAERDEIDRVRLERHLDHECKKRGITRRDLLKGGAGMAAAIGLGGLFAACGGDDEAAPAPATVTPPAEGEPPAVSDSPQTIRVLGLGVGEIGGVIDTAFNAATGHTVTFELTDSVTMVQKALTQPESFDIFAGYHYQYDQIWAEGSFQSIDRTRIPEWENISNIYKFGKREAGDANCTTGQGDAPFRLLYTDSTPAPGNIVQWGADDGSGADGEEPPGVTGVPNYFNMDSMGYNSDEIPLEPNELSWAELFNTQHQGRVAIVADPGIGFPDAALAAEAAGLMTFADKGDMTREEIDALIKIMLELKSAGQFRAFWVDFNESVNLMQSGEVVIESMWSPAVALLQSSGFPVRYAAPIEGFRGWSGGHAIAAHLTDPAKLQGAYDYINWWLSGEPGAVVMRQGYYSPVQENTKNFSEPFEYEFWIEGQPASDVIPDPFGGDTLGIPVGSVRDGGSFVDRACNYAVWNSYFTESEYQVERWQEVIAA
jgi:putative spermidine/putrescine transport system substrate-binding protein